VLRGNRERDNVVYWKTNGKQHPTVGRLEARMGVRLLGRAMLRPDGCGGHHLRFCGNGFDL